MAKRANRTCYTCGKEYYFCPNCPSETRIEVFYHMFCCERCSKIFKSLTDETFKHITTKQCKDELVGLGVSPNENFKECINRHVKEVFDYKEPEIIEIKPEIKLETEPEKELLTDTKTDTVIENDVVLKEESEEIELSKPVRKAKKIKNSEVD